MRNQIAQRNLIGAVLALLAAMASVSCGVVPQNLMGGTATGNHPAGLTLNTSSLDFGAVSLAGSKSNSITLSNSSTTSTESVVLSQVSVTGAGFSATTAPLPITLAPGQGTLITVSFAPKSSGAASGVLSLVVSGGVVTGGSSTVTIALTGSGLGAGQLGVSPATLPLGSVAVGSSVSQTGTLTAGASSVTISSASVTGQGYAISGVTFPLTVASGTSVSYSVTFTPKAAGSVSGSISFLSNASNSPASQTLTGTGTQASTPPPAPAPSPSPAQLSVSPTTLALGSVTVGASASKMGTLTAANSSVTVSSAAWSGQGYSVTGITFPVTIAAGASVTYTVTFAPQTAGSSAGSISFVSTASGSPTVETFTGTGTAPATPVAHSVGLTWDASTSTVVGYNVYRGTQSGGPYSKLNTTPQPATSYTDGTVQAGATYFYVTTSVDASSAESANSDEATAVVPSP